MELEEQMFNYQYVENAKVFAYSKGYGLGYDNAIDKNAKVYDAGVKDGERGMGEWGNGRCEHSETYTRRHRCFKCWQAKIKEE